MPSFTAVITFNPVYHRPSLGHAQGGGPVAFRFSVVGLAARRSGESRSPGAPLDSDLRRNDELVAEPPEKSFYPGCVAADMPAPADADPGIALSAAQKYLG